MPNPLVSIVMPIYNGERYIANTVKCLFSQTYSNFEVIFIDDGSNDKSAEILNSYCTDPRFKYINQQNAGVAEARNAGIEASSGQFIALLDQDDLWLPHKLQSQVEYMLLNPDCGLVHSQIGFIDGEDNITLAPDWAWVGETYGYCLPDLFNHNRLATFTALFKSSIVNDVGFFRESLAPSDDWDYWLRIASKYPLGFIPEISGYYRLHSNNESKNLERMQLAELRVIENFILEFPGAFGQLSSELIKQKRFQLYTNTAKLYQNLKKPAQAKEYWKKAFGQHPLQPECIVGILWNQLSVDQQKSLNWYSHQLLSRLRK